jgi:glutathione S-transferase
MKGREHRAPRAAIQVALARLRPVTVRALVGRRPASLLFGQSCEQYDHEPSIAVVRFWLAYSGRPDAFADRLEERTAAGYRALGAMEVHLAGGREWFVGDGMTLADIALYAYTHVAHEGSFELGRFPTVQAWLSRVAAMPGHVPIDA